MWLAAAIIGVLPLAALADTQADIIDLHPADGATLAASEAFYVRIEYRTDEPVSLWARPFLRGQEVKQARSNASASYTGSGEARGWFALTGNGDVDEVRVLAGGGKPYREWELARLPVSLQWTAGSSPGARAEPAWVGQLRAQAAASMRRDAASAPVTSEDVALVNGFMLAMLAIGLGGIIVPIWSYRKWRGAWRMAAAVPAAMVLFVILRIVVGTSLDPTSHNLWPFEVLMFSALSLAIVGVLKVLRKFLGVQVPDP